MKSGPLADTRRPVGIAGACGSGSAGGVGAGAEGFDGTTGVEAESPPQAAIRPKAAPMRSTRPNLGDPAERALSVRPATAHGSTSHLGIVTSSGKGIGVHRRPSADDELQPGGVISGRLVRARRGSGIRGILSGARHQGAGERTPGAIEPRHRAANGPRCALAVQCRWVLPPRSPPRTCSSR